MWDYLKGSPLGDIRSIGMVALIGPFDLISVLTFPMLLESSLFREGVFSRILEVSLAAGVE